MQYETPDSPETMEFADLAHGDSNRRSTPRRLRRIRRTAAMGVAAGLLGGGAVGLLLTVPSSTSAATATTAMTEAARTSTTESESVSELTEPAADVPVDPPIARDESARPDPAGRLRESLQALVDDGTITADQADAVTAHLVANRPERGDRPMWGRRPGRRGVGPDLNVVATVLGTDVETLRADLRSGSSLADVASAAGIDIQVVIDAFVDHASDRLQAAVA